MEELIKILSEYKITVYLQPAQYKGMLSILANPDDVDELKKIFKKLEEIKNNDNQIGRKK